MKNLIYLAILLFFSCQPNSELPVCQYQAIGQQSFINDIETTSGMLSADPVFNFPYDSPDFQDLVDDLNEHNANTSTQITVDESRVITVEVEASEVYLQVLFAGTPGNVNITTVEFVEIFCD